MHAIISLRHSGVGSGSMCSEDRKPETQFRSLRRGDLLTVVAFIATRCRWWSRGPVWLFLTDGRRGASVALPDWWEAWTEKSLSRVLLFASMDCSPWILQARTLEWVAFPFSRGSSQARDWTQVSRIVGRFFTSWTTREARKYCSESVAYSFSRGPSWPRNRTAVSCIAGGFFTNRATREALVGGGRFINCILDAS